MDNSRQPPLGDFPPSLAWTITIATALGALAVSLLPGRWASEAFSLLRFAAIFYGLTAAYSLLKMRVESLAHARIASDSIHRAN